MPLFNPVFLKTMCLPKKTLYKEAKILFFEKILNMNVYFEPGISYFEKTSYIIGDLIFGEI